MRTTLPILALLVACVTARAQSPIMVMLNPTNSAVVSPTNFWDANAATILAAIGSSPGGGSNFIDSVSSDFDVSAGLLSVTNTSGTGAILRASSLSPYLTSAAAASLYQPADPNLTAMALGDGGSLTNLDGSAILSGTVADARIAASIARLASPALTGTPTAPTATPGTSNTTVATTAYVDRAVAAGGGGGGGGGASIAPNWFARTEASGTNVVILPQPVDTTTASTWAPDFSAGRVHQVTMNGNLTLSAPDGVTEDMVGQTFLLVLVQDSTGGRTVTPATNYLFGLEVTGIGVSTNAGSRSYVNVLLRRTNVVDVLGSLTGYAP